MDYFSKFVRRFSNSNSKSKSKSPKVISVTNQVMNDTLEDVETMHLHLSNDSENCDLNFQIKENAIKLTDLSISAADLGDPAVTVAPIYTSQKPFQPHVNFPLTDGRKFNADWYKIYVWLEYSIKLDAMFCFPCRYFNKTFKKNKNNEKYREKGVRDWKNAARNLKNHDKSDSHKCCYSFWISRITNNNTIACKISSQYEKDSRLNKKNLTTIINSVYYLCRQGLAFRAHDETKESKNNGNFLQLLELVSNYDEDLKDHLKNNSNC